ncbi:MULTISPECIES: hypothetical protein [Halorussus]|uniref:hypothetical protein n=1 Tax=Halorussus TaxID=1070314 RepID=UPI000E20FDB9|nr:MULTISPECIES: hypothetical protein [Halorussus]NHN59821.1 hypothetical protein [Halorussus sp. JP-T4]
MGDKSVSWSSLTGVPDWVGDLKTLTTAGSGGIVGTLVTIATDPRDWLRENVFALIAEWIVNQILDGATYIIGWVVFAFDRIASIILDALGPVATPFEIIGDAVVGAVETVYGVALAAAHAAGFTGPPAAAFAVALVSAALAAVVFAVWKALPVTEALGGGMEALR